MYALVDCNNFYVACERLFNPKLEGKPVIVLSNNDGCAIARSEEAKQLGIAMANPFFMMQELIKKNNVQVFSSNYTLYADMSDRVMRTLAEFVPRIEVYSIDEAFLDMSELVYQDLLKLGLEIRKAVKQRIGIPVSVGIAPTKALAKMSNRYSKKKFRDIGVFWAANDELINEMLSATPVDEIWGVGGQYAHLLRRNNMHTAMDFVNAPDEWVRKNMTVQGQRLWFELKGIESFGWKTEPQRKKNICISRAFGKLLSGKTEIKEALCNYAAACAAKLRQEQSCAKKMNVFLQTNPHKTDHQQLFNSITVELPQATNLTAEIIRYACKGFEKIYETGYRFMKCGVIVMDLVPEQQVQLSLFDAPVSHKEKLVAKITDAINQSEGREVVRSAVQGFDKKYKMRADHLSHRYTTNINEIVKIKI